MNQTVKGVIISVIISFTVPTLVVASQWGGINANQAEIMRQLDRLDRKVDKVTEKVNDTREDLAILKGKSLNSS